MTYLISAALVAGLFYCMKKTKYFRPYGKDDGMTFFKGGRL